MITLSNNVAASRYELLDDVGRTLGFAEYRLLSHSILFAHTVVFPGHEGLGVQLARYVLDDARRQRRRVLPVCPFRSSPRTSAVTPSTVTSFLRSSTPGTGCDRLKGTAP